MTQLNIALIFFIIRAIDAVTCPAGQYLPTADSNSCSACSPGQYQAYDGQTNCVPCRAGSYSVTSGASTCTNCTSGFSCSAGSSTFSCSGCPSGYHSTKGTICFPCPPGTTWPAAIPGQSSCNNCQSGYYSPGRSQCFICAAGTFAREGFSLCPSCPFGTWTSTQGATACQACPEGTSTSILGAISSSACSVCPAGLYPRGLPYDNSCAQCPVGKYSPQSGLSSCLNCPAGLFSTSGWSACVNLTQIPSTVPTTALPIQHPFSNEPTTMSSSPSTSPIVDCAKSPSSSFSISVVIIGVVVGIVVFIALCVVAILYWISLKKKQETTRRKQFDTSVQLSDESKFTSIDVDRNVGLTPPTASKSLIPVFEGSEVPSFDWSQIIIDPNRGDTIVGEGSFGKVIRAKVSPYARSLRDIVGEEEIVIKVLTVGKHGRVRVPNTPGTMEKDKVLTGALREVQMILDITSKLKYKDCIVKVYGIVEGPLLRSEVGLFLAICSGRDYPVGIIMRREAGGSLKSHIHRLPDSILPPLPIEIKIKLLADVARGLAELHSQGIVHGDIKPDNVLISGGDPMEARLADFGLTEIRGIPRGLHSTMAKTNGFRGTPLYSAPEMMINLFPDDTGEFVARSSRTTDMYAFAILAWEVFCEEIPFSDEGITRNIILAMRLHQGLRPPLNKLPIQCPYPIRQMISKCWDADRNIRKSAIECWSILSRQYYIWNKLSSDICISHCNKNKGIAEYLYNHFNLRGMRTHMTCIDNDGVDEDICASRVLIVILSQSFHAGSNCLELLKFAADTMLPGSITVVTVSDDFELWISPEAIFNCQLRNEEACRLDLSSVSYDWDSPIIEESKFNSEDRQLFTNLVNQYSRRVLLEYFDRRY